MSQCINIKPCMFSSANPVLNLNIDSATDLGFDEDGSSADRER